MAAAPSPGPAWSRAAAGDRGAPRSRQTQRSASEPAGPTVAADDAPTSCLGDNGTASLPWALSTATCSAQVRRPASRPSCPSFPASSQPQRPTLRCRQICAGTTSSCSNFPDGSVHFRPFPLEKISPAPGNRIPKENRHDDEQRPSRERSQRRRGGRQGVRARLPGAATVQWLTAAWTDTGRATAAAAELAAIAGAAILLAYTGTIIAFAAASGAALLAVRAAGLAWKARQQLEQPKNGTGRSFPDTETTTPRAEEEKSNSRNPPATGDDLSATAGKGAQGRQTAATTPNGTIGQTARTGTRRVDHDDMEAVTPWTPRTSGGRPRCIHEEAPPRTNRAEPCGLLAFPKTMRLRRKASACARHQQDCVKRTTVMNNGAGRMRQGVSVLGILIAAATAITCGDDGGPTSPTPPTPQVPQVAGIYRGPATITSSIVGSVMGYSEMEVAQAGSQVTITGWMTIGTDTVPLPAATGTINETGFFSLDAGGTNIVFG